MGTTERTLLRPRKRLWTVNKRYLAAAVLLLLVEIYIALRVHDTWIRPYGGDVLVVIFLYCLARAFLKVAIVPTAVGVLVFSFVVEILQFFRFVERMGLKHNRFAVVVIGSSFEWLDLVSYSVGAVLVLLFEALIRSRQSRPIV
jgi:Protein of unknown function (DUF2809)